MCGMSPRVYSSCAAGHVTLRAVTCMKTRAHLCSFWDGAGDFSWPHLPEPAGRVASQELALGPPESVFRGYPV